jgi:O-antigen/teichoic acid export membrane protein
VVASLPEIVIRPALFCLALIGLVFTGNTVDQITVFASLAAAGLAALVIGQWCVVKMRPQALATAKAIMRPKAWCLAVLPIMGAQGLALLIAQIDVLMLSWFHPLAEVGIYRVALQFGLLCGLGYTAINMVMSQKFAHAIAADDRKMLARAAKSAARLAFGATCAMAILLLLIAKPLIAIAFGAEFGAAFVPLVILLGTQIVNALFGLPRGLLLMAGHERLIMWTSLAALALALLLGILLIPQFAATGAAISVLVPVILLNVVFWYTALKSEKIDTGIW